MRNRKKGQASTVEYAILGLVIVSIIISGVAIAMVSSLEEGQSSILEKMVLKKQPRLSVTSINVPSEVTAGQTATVSAIVTNTGGKEGTKTIDFVVEGETVDSQEVTVGPGETKTVTFQIEKGEKGTYDLNIGGASATLTIVAAPKPTEKLFKVVYIGDNPKTSPWAIANTDGIKTAIKSLDEEYPYIDFKFIWSSGVSRGSIIPTAEQHIEKGADLIIGGTYGAGSTYAQLAKEYPNVPFVNFNPKENFVKMDPGTTAGYAWEMWKPSYLAGIIAGAVTETNKIGYINAYDFPYSRLGVNAYKEGAELVNPDVEILYTTSGSFYEPTKGAAATSLLVQKGADVIDTFGDGMTQGAVRKAEESGVYIFGELTNLEDLGPNSVLQSQILNAEVRYKKLIKAAIENELDGMYVHGGIQNKLITLDYNDKLLHVIPENVRNLVNKKIQKIRAGELEIPHKKEEFPVI